jgi:hypothetical protein
MRRNALRQAAPTGDHWGQQCRAVGLSGPPQPNIAGKFRMAGRLSGTPDESAEDEFLGATSKEGRPTVEAGRGAQIGTRKS